MTFISLFAGIGGIDLGLERAGMRCVGQVEINPFCRRVLAKHWPDVPRFDDVRSFQCDHLPARPVLVAAGFPCQDLSSAGRGAGIDGKRSGLWVEVVRVVRDLRPAYLILENVTALLGRGLGRVLGALAAIGYDAEWDCLPAAAFGAPHVRDRLYVVSYPAGVGQPQPRIFGQDARGGPTRRDWETTDALNAIRRGAVPALCRGAHGVPDRMDRLKSLGNSVVIDAVEWIGRRILEAESAA